ncbi:protein translocase subunit SecF [bacterium]|nr:protein translocase subunit SecF [bacterium]
MSTKNFAHFGKIDFMKISPIMGAVSVITFVVALFFIATKGFHFGIDFEGGTEVQVKFASTPDVAKVRTLLSEIGSEGASVQTFGTENEILIRMQQAKGATNQETNKLNQAMIEKLTTALKTNMALPEDGIRRVDSVGPQVGAELKNQAILSVIYSLIVILIYVGLRFDFRYSPGAVLCLFHDTIVLLGIYSLIGREVNVQVLAGVLTLIGYSLNDTIVVYDSIRENEPIYKEKGLNFVINRSVNEMLMRTVLTGGTTLISSFCLFFLGTGVIQDIAFTMILGVLLGTFSSVYVAAPLIPLTDKLIKKFA